VNKLKSRKEKIKFGTDRNIEYTPYKSVGLDKTPASYAVPSRDELKKEG